MDHGCLTCCLLPACSLLIDWGAAQGGREGGRGRILFEHRKQMVIEKEGGGRFLKYKFQKSLFWNIHSHSTTCFLLLLIIIHYAHLLLCLDRQKVVPKLHALLALFSSPPLPLPRRRPVLLRRGFHRFSLDKSTKNKICDKRTTIVKHQKNNYY